MIFLPSFPQSNLTGTCLSSRIATFLQSLLSPQMWIGPTSVYKDTARQKKSVVKEDQNVTVESKKSSCQINIVWFPLDFNHPFHVNTWPALPFNMLTLSVHKHYGNLFCSEWTLSPRTLPFLYGYHSRTKMFYRVLKWFTAFYVKKSTSFWFQLWKHDVFPSLHFGKTSFFFFWVQSYFEKRWVKNY